MPGDRRFLDELCQREWSAVYGMIHRPVQNQTDQEAEVLALGLLVRTHPDGRTTFWSPGRYWGSMRKIDGSWLIHRWNFQWDADPAMNL